MAAPTLHPALASGCLMIIGILALCGVFIYGPSFPSGHRASLEIALVGRYQIIAARSVDYEQDKDDLPRVFKLDTATGQTWIYCPLETSGNGTGGHFLVAPHRWLEFSNFVPKAPSISPIPTP